MRARRLDRLDREPRQRGRTEWSVHLLFIAAVALAGASISVAAVERHVDPAWASIEQIPQTLSLGTTAFASVTAAIAEAHEGDTILVHGGRYDDTTERFPLVVDQAITIRAASPDKPAILAGSLGSVVFEVHSSGVIIQGLTILHRASGMIVAADDVTIQANEIILDIDHIDRFAVGGCGIWLAGARRAILEGNRFVDCGLCIAGPPVSQGTSTALALSSWLYVGEDREWFSTHRIIDNSINGRELRYIVGESDIDVSNETLGQLLLIDCNRGSVCGLTIAGSSVGIQLAHCRNVTVSECRIENQTVFGVYSAYSRSCTLDRIDCTVVNHGIDLRGCTDVTVSRCTVEAPQQGIFSDAGLCNSILGCTVLEPVVGIALYAEEWSTIQANRVIEARFGMALHRVANDWLFDNIVTASSAVGLRIDEGSHGVSITRNQFGGNRASIVVLDSQSMLIQENMIRDSSLSGVFLSDACCVRILDNSFSGNAVELHTQGSCPQVTWQGNTMDGDELASTSLP